MRMSCVCRQSSYCVQLELVHNTTETLAMSLAMYIWCIGFVDAVHDAAVDSSIIL